MPAWPVSCFATSYHGEMASWFPFFALFIDINQTAIVDNICFFCASEPVHTGLRRHRRVRAEPRRALTMNRMMALTEAPMKRAVKKYARPRNRTDPIQRTI
jgi:hypothetical protein